MTKVEVRNLVKVFDKFVAVNDVSFTVNSGEFFGLLGPSGCGKTTTLYCISGIETPTSGKILFDDKDITKTPPQRRNIGMVFQSYAIFSNMNVYDNLAYPLRIRRTPKNEVNKMVTETAELLGIKSHLRTKGSKLTPAQMQLVALGRAIIYNPSVLLLDEPLSNLDPSFRMDTLRHIRRVQRLLKITTIFVTHDQYEALSACDRIAVMRSGKIIQLGTTDEIYYNPRHTFVAEFVGTPPMNLLETKVVKKDGKIFLDAKEFERPVHISGISIPEEDSVIVGFKPEDVNIHTGGEIAGDGLMIRGRIRSVERNPIENIYIVEVNGKIIKFVSSAEIAAGVSVMLVIPTSRIYVYSGKTGMLVTSPNNQKRIASLS